MGVVKLLLNCKSVCSVPSFGASQREQKLDEEKLTPGIFMLIFYGHILHVASVRVLSITLFAKARQLNASKYRLNCSCSTNNLAQGGLHTVHSNIFLNLPSFSFSHSHLC